MKIYIPNSLRKVVVVDQLANMIEYYLKNVEKEDNFSFQYYNYSLKLDPVKEFVDLCLENQELSENQDKENISSYLTRLFYGVKGTLKVFDYMETYLGIRFTGKVVYTTELVELGIENILIEDIDLFYQLLTEFLNSLLYFSRLNITTVSTDLLISSEVSNSIGSGFSKYEHLEVSRYEVKNQ